MDLTVKLDCKLGDTAALLEHRSALVAAILLYKSYVASKEMLIGTGPELYAEQWLANFIFCTERNFEDLILIYFVKVLQASINKKFEH